MLPTPTTITIHLNRLDKPARTYREGLVGDNGVRVRTFTALPGEIGQSLARNFQRQGFLSTGQTIASVAKWLFYNEFFSIVEYRDPMQAPLGYYCDIVTPLQRDGDAYHLTDLFLDIWVTPDHRAYELDWDEFTEAVERGLVGEALRRKAVSAMERLRSEVQQGIFPEAYLR